jgi:hypothetical protein
MRCRRQWLWTTPVALTVAVLAAWVGVRAQAQTAPQEPLLWARNVAGDTRAIQVNADDAVTWVDQGKRIILLKGKVWVEQGDARLRTEQAVLWIDETAQKQSGIYHVDIYGDGDASLELKTQSYQSATALIELHTRGIINLKTFKNKVVQQATPDDPLLKRAINAMAAQKAQPKPKQPSSALLRSNNIQQASYQEVAAREQGQPLDSAQFAPAPVAPGAGQPVPSVLAPGPPTTPGVPQPPPVLEQGPGPQFSIRPRSSILYNSHDEPLQNGEKATIVTGGVIISITVPTAVAVVPAVKGPEEPAPAPGILPPVTPGKDNKGVPGPISVTDKDGRVIDLTSKTVEIAADRVVIFWGKGDFSQLTEGTPAEHGARKYELYLGGNVELREEIVKRTGAGPVVLPRMLRCSEGYVFFRGASPEEPEGRNVAIVLNTELFELQPGLPDPIHVSAPEMHQLTSKLFEASHTQLDASKLPYGPGLYLTTGEASLEQKRIEKRTIFNMPFISRETGEPEYEDQLLFRGRNVFVWLEDVPVFWWPYVQGDARDPLGPLQSASIGYNRVFGFEIFTTWNVYNLFGMDPVPGTRWRVGLDYLTARGPEINTEFFALGKDLFGVSGKYTALVKAMGIDDNGVDILGGNRGQFVTYGYPPPTTTLPITHPELRGRFYGQLNWQELPYFLTFQTQLAAISDKNFLDQYYNPEWLNGPNQETFAYLKQQQNDWAWTFLVEPRIRNWITETEWLPKADAYWIGQDFLETLTYTTRAGAAYGHLEPTHQQPLAFEPTDVNMGTGRFDWWNELALPMQLGAFKVVPYGVADFTYYTEDLNNQEDFRTYAGGGIRGSIPFSRLYPDVQSELFNVDGIYHKIVFAGNYYWVHSDRSHLNFPQLDRLNDDASDQALRDIRPQQPTLNPANAVMLNSGFFDPQLFAIRKLVNSYVDTLDSIEEVELDVRQRWQTKRGFPGQEHIIDWMTLDLGVSLFPQPNTQNFGEVVNFLQYDWAWMVGDRVALFSSGWFDPHPGAARVWSFGTNLNRPDSSNLYIGYRQIDPLQSRQVIASVNLPFSAKYSIGASTAYDFGTNTQINSLTVTRRGTDLQVMLGFTYNSILNTFGFTFEVYPNLLPGTKQVTAGLGNVMGSR